MDLRLTGKAALITGASRGIGAAITSGLAAEGCRVAIVARDEAGLAQMRTRLEEMGAEVLALPADLTEPEAAAQSSSSGCASTISIAWRPIDPVAPSSATRFTRSV